MRSAGLSRLFRWVCAGVLSFIPASSRAEAVSEITERVHRGLEGIRVPFIANAGQTDPAVAYYAATPGGTVFVTREGGIVYSLSERGPSAAGRLGTRDSAGL